MSRRIVLVLGLLLAMPALTGPALGLVDFDRDTLEIQTADKRYKFNIELALSPEQHAQGLMFRRSMEPDAGMLFLFERARPVSFWMKNTYIPLDIVFIAEDGHIVNIAERTIPLSTKAIPSEGPVLGILELNSGTARLLGIAPGDTVVYPAFGTAE